MLEIGLTGGIASGKTTVAAMLQERGAHVIDADRIARELVRPGMPAWRQLGHAFGNGIYRADGQLDRNALAAIIFKDKAARERLNAIMHPPIIEAIRRQRAQWRNTGGALLVLDIPLLYETGLDREVEMVVVVVSSDCRRLQRLMDKSGLTKEQALQRLQSQMPLEQKAARADYLIANNGTLADLAAAVEAFWQRIVQPRRGQARPQRADE